MTGANATHPDLTADRRAEWLLMRDTASGARAVKARGETYLPKPGGFKAMGDGGKAMFDAYLFRAIVPEIVGPSIGAMIGIIHGKEAQIALPDAMSGLWEDADGDGMPLEAFHRKITRNLLWLGRYGVLVTAPEAGGEPYLVGYAGDSIINWDRDFFVLDETGYQRRGFGWDLVCRYRVLSIRDGAYVSEVYEGEAGAVALVSEAGAESRGGARLDFVPFVVGNAREVAATLEPPPLIGVANATIAAYQLSADWRHQLFMSGQETMVAINGPAPSVVGAGVVHAMNELGVSTQTPDLKYVSPTCSGIEAHERAIAQQRQEAVAAGARMFDQAQTTQESGEARRLRFASETANLMSVAQVSAAILERSLRNAAVMMGAAADEVVVKPPADLLDSTMTADEFQKLFSVYQANGMSWETFYERGQAGGIFSPERTAEEEQDLIDGMLGQDPNGP
ncbi:DUF4055 domain-containing protein [Segnochrobactraceae bacterium EtOH-i3]